MALAELIDYEKLHELELLHPETDQPLGVVFHVRSMNSPEVTKVVTEQLNKRTERQQRGKLVSGEAAIKDGQKQVAACIAGWDWDGKELFKGEGVLEHSVKNAQRAVEIPWIFEQVKEAAEQTANFSNK
ncbi:hypothetical protein [Roseibium sp. RKSG952]|uniref:hypothetical protein n=1 Tax=Roseibium sp. RKSG952 TaxID=2529384 RepID=UPI0012BBCAEF|nr:hypothetical protein [Roseibium sp. RKSG952]MTH96421.1 hypothetical protein [Roseibium sp. RKSG952]